MPRIAFHGAVSRVVRREVVRETVRPRNGARSCTVCMQVCDPLGTPRTDFTHLTSWREFDDPHARSGRLWGEELPVRRNMAAVMKVVGSLIRAPRLGPLGAVMPEPLSNGEGAFLAPHFLVTTTTTSTGRTFGSTTERMVKRGRRSVSYLLPIY